MPADIQASGLKPTLPRIQVLNAFHTSPERHLAAEDVYRLLLQGGVDLGLATVYRVLAQFESFCTVTESIRQGFPVTVQVFDSTGAALK